MVGRQFVRRLWSCVASGLWLVVATSGAFGQSSERAAHWAYRPLVRPAPPRPAQNAEWARNPVDWYALRQLHAEQLPPGAAESPERLARRLHLALTGLPPTLAELDAFLDEQARGAPDAVDRLVDRLLASPAYGERMALPWLDLARYADTHGYHADTHREMWRWRDWVIQSLNRNLPFDQFSIEQLAGDLLPQPTLDQQIATGFQRNHMIIFENGVIGEEYRHEYVADRTVTFATVWLGQTFQCARCHDHKHDPFSQRDFYRLSAFFNNVPENGVDGQFGNAEPFIPAPTALQQEALSRIDRESARIDAFLAERLARPDAAQAAWEAERRRDRPRQVEPPGDVALRLPLDESPIVDSVPNETGRQASPERLPLHGQASWAPSTSGQALLFDGETWIDAGDVEPLDRQQPVTWSWLAFVTSNEHLPVASRSADDLPRRGWELSITRRRVRLRLTKAVGADELLVETRSELPLRKWRRITLVYDGSSRAAGVQIWIDGVRQELEVRADTLAGSVRVASSLRLGRNQSGDGFRGMLDDIRLWLRALSPEELSVLAGRDPIAEIVSLDPARRSPRQAQQLRQWFLAEHDAEFRAQTARREALRQERAALSKTIPTTMVMRELPMPRPTFVLERGDYERRKEPVTAGWPAIGDSAASPSPRDSTVSPETTAQPATSLNRLDLARWLFAPDHPLTARVAANRMWRELFGWGIVETSDDFGTHGAAPVDDQLLDWLACELGRGDRAWDMKALHRTLCSSALFQQTNRWQATMNSASKPTSAPTNTTERENPPDDAREAVRARWQRGPRQRLAAEAVRDSALAAAGLLDRRIGGPSVFPPQPPGLWEEVAYDTESFTAQKYLVGRGGDLYRRGLYTFWKRAVTPPALAVFDAPDREVCIATRTVSSSPLQALVLMNEETYVAAARELARSAMREADGDDERLTQVFRRVLARLPAPRELDVLRETLKRERDELRARPDQVRRLLGLAAAADSASASDSSSTAPVSDRDLANAALMLTASVVLELDEALVP